MREKFLGALWVLEEEGKWGVGGGGEGPGVKLQSLE